jgi:hypothetical protein
MRRDKKAAEAGQPPIIPALPVTRNIRFDIILSASLSHLTAWLVATPHVARPPQLPSRSVSRIG